MKLETGDILHCTRKSFLSWLIRKATKSNFNHSAVIVEIWNQTYVVGSQSDGTQLRPFDTWVKKYGYKYEVSRPLEINKEEFSKKALSATDTNYDFTTLFLRGPVKIITGRWKKKKDEFEKLYCSEYVAWCYSIEYESIMSPQDLYEYCNSRADLFFVP